jgi:hypothetical protein
MQEVSVVRCSNCDTNRLRETRTSCVKQRRYVRFPEKSEVVHRNVDGTNSASRLNADAGDKALDGHEGVWAAIGSLVLYRAPSKCAVTGMADRFPDAQPSRAVSSVSRC